MNKYHGTYLQKYSFEIPEELYTNGCFTKSEDLYIHGIVKKNIIDNISKNVKDIKVESDDIQLYITIYNQNDLNYLKNIYWFELSMPNEQRALLNSLKAVQDCNFEILDCTGVDTTGELTGKSKGILEVIAKYRGEMSSAKSAADNVIFKIKENNGNGNENEYDAFNKMPFHDQSIVDTNNYKCIASAKYDKENRIITIPSDSKCWKDFKKLINPNRCYLSITSVSEGNFITVKFKSKKELIVSLEITFKAEKEDDNYEKTKILVDIIKSLTEEIGVDFKFMTLNDSDTKKMQITYDIKFDVANTGLEDFDRESRIEFISAFICNESIINIDIRKEDDYHAGNRNYFEENSSDMSSKDWYIKDFKENVLSLLKRTWKNQLENCIKCSNNIDSSDNCFLETPIERKQFKELLRRINNAKFSGVDISLIKKTITNFAFSNGNCNIDKNKMKDSCNQILSLLNGINNHTSSTVTADKSLF